MAYSADKNLTTFQRMKNLCVALQNIREEAVRLQNVHDQEAKPGGVADAAYVDTDIATVAEFEVMYSYLTEFREFNDGNGPTAGLQVARWGQLVPFIDTTPA